MVHFLKLVCIYYCIYRTSRDYNPDAYAGYSFIQYNDDFVKNKPCMISILDYQVETASYQVETAS